MSSQAVQNNEQPIIQPKPGIMDIAPYKGGKSTAKPGVKVVKLSSNETPLGASPLAAKAFIESANQLHRYPEGSAQRLRNAISTVYNLPAENLVCSSGSDELIGLLIHAYAGAGDEIVMSEHGFLMYKIYGQGYSATVTKVKEDNLRTDVDAMLSAITPNTKIVFVANPNNPTGSYITKDELQKLHQGLPSNVLLVVDGAYSEYANKEDYTDGCDLVASSQNVVVLRTFSKIYGLSALRLGWCYAPVHVCDVLNRIRSPFNVSIPAMEAGIAAVQDIEFTNDTREFNNSWLVWLSDEIEKLGLKVYPSIANFVLVEFSQGKHSASAANDFMSERGLIPREVGNYGLPNCLRISIGLEEDNRAVVQTLADFLAS